MTILEFLAIGLLLTVLISAGLLGRRADQRRRQRLSSRESLDDAWTHYMDHEEVSRESVDIVLKSVTKAIGVAPGKLAPTDRFGVELAPDRGWEYDDGLAEVEWDLRALGLRDLRSAQTLGDLARLVDAHLRASDR